MWSCIPWHSWLDFRFQWCFYCHTYKVQTHSETLFLQCPVEYCHTQCATTVFLISTAKDNLEGDKFNGGVRGMFPSPTTPNLKRHLSMFSRDASSISCPILLLEMVFIMHKWMKFGHTNVDQVDGIDCESAFLSGIKWWVMKVGARQHSQMS